MKTIFITGEAGSGKTMLLRAIACQFLRHKKQQLIHFMNDVIDQHVEHAQRLIKFFKLEEQGKAFVAAYTSDRTNRLGARSHDFDKENYKKFILGEKVSYHNHETDLLFFARVRNFYFDEGKVPEPFRPTHSECLELIKKSTAHEANYKNNGLSEIRLVKEDSYYQYRQVNGYLCDFDEMSTAMQDNITVFCDLLIRLKIANKGIDDISQFKGLVLIDDIAPNSTMGAMISFTKFLEETFPNVQFIVTTSKLMVGGSYNDEDTKNLAHQLCIEKTTFVLVQFGDGSAPCLWCCDKHTNDFHF